MSGHTLRDRIRNEDIWKGLGFANIEEKMKDNHLRWFEYLQRQGIIESVRKIESWIPKDLNFRTFVATWNMGGKFPETGLVLDDFLQVNAPSDIYILG